jgi:urease accessory protein UreH
VPTQYSGTPIHETIAYVAHEELRIEGRLRVVEVTGAWGAYAGERIIVGEGASFRDDLGIKIRETFEAGAADALAEGRSPSEHFELPNVRITIEVVPSDADA